MMMGNMTMEDDMAMNHTSMDHDNHNDHTSTGHDTSTDHVLMKMYFHFSAQATILFAGWETMTWAGK